MLDINSLWFFRLKNNNMIKKSINKKKAREFIIESRLNKKSDQEIYNKLSEQYLDKKTIAKVITRTVTKEYKDKYKVLNIILLCLIGIAIIFKVIPVFGMNIETGGIWPLLLIFVVMALNLYFFYEVFRFNANIYKLIGFLSVVNLFRFLINLEEAGILDIVLSLGTGLGIIGLSFYLGSRLIPNYNPINMKKDENGEYIL